MNLKSSLKFAVVFFPSWGIVILLTWLFYGEQDEDMRTEILGEQRTACQMTQNIMEDELRSLFSELKRLSVDPMVLDALTDDPAQQETAIHRLEDSYLRLIEATGAYDQIRILNVQGKEIVRINYGDAHPNITPPEKLQNKRGRYYFQDTIKLKQGEVYISPFDLNIENRKLERPLKPMIRVATPIVDPNNHTQGILIINYLGKILLKKISRYAQTAHASTTLLNADGYWLKGESVSDEWRFMFPLKKQISFANRYPQIWRQFSKAKGGQFESVDGVFTYATVFPLKVNAVISSDGSPEARGSSTHRIRTDDYYWYIVNRIPPRTWRSLQMENLSPVLLVFSFISIGLFVGVMILTRAIERRNAAERALQETNRDLERKVLARTAQLRREIEIRRMAEQQQKDAARELESIFRTSGDGLMVMDTSGRITHVNPAACRFLNQSEEAILNRKCCDVMTEEACGTELCPLTRLAGGERHVEHEAVKIRADGIRQTGLITAVPHIDGKGDIRGYIFNIKDVTEWKKVVEENRSLEGQLRQAQKMEAIGTLAGGIAHDFNNILMVIIVNLELAMTALSEEDQATELLKRVMEASERATDLVRQILTFSRKSEQKRVPVSLTEIVKDTTRFLHASLPANISMSFELPDNLPNLMADPTGLHQILLNLCTNAAQAMKGGGRIKITCDSIHLENPSTSGLSNLSPGRYQRLTVADTGLGMDSETVNRIFDPFFTTKSPGEGTGLGLSVVHGIVRSHGGDIQVRSRPGAGTVFNVFLEETGIPETMEHAAPTSEYNASGETVLYIDDELQLLEAGKHILQREGYNVVTFASGDDVLAYLQRNPGTADMLLSDCTMPHIGGLELAKAALAINPSLPIVIYSGFMTPDIEEGAYRIGVKKVLYKPLGGKELARQLGKVLATCRNESNPSSTVV